MRLRQLLQFFLITGSVWILGTNPANGEEVQDSNITNAKNNQQLLYYVSKGQGEFG